VHLLCKTNTVRECYQAQGGALHRPRGGRPTRSIVSGPVLPCSFAFSWLDLLKYFRMSLKVLSKSRIMDGLQCPKKLYLELHQKDLKAPASAADQLQFDQGHEVGAEARTRYPGGLLIDKEPWDYQGGHEATEQAIKAGANTIYEASFFVGDLFVRVDILHRADKRSGWQVIEVKKSTSVKDHYIQDVAIQALVLKAAGFKAKSYHMMFLNKKCVFPELGDLFIKEDITDQVKVEMPTVTKAIEAFRKVVMAKKEPAIDIGPRCDSPYACGFKEYCWKKIPAQSVFEIPGMSGWELYEAGKLKIVDLDEAEFSGKARRAIEVVKSGVRQVDGAGIAKELKAWKWPLYFLDFETLGLPIPMYKGTRPYMAVPFQFSCHVWRGPREKDLEHFEYLHVSGGDPRPELLTALCDGLGVSGSIVAYTKSFEASVLRGLGEFDRKRKIQLLSIAERLVDPLPIFQSFVYDAGFKGSFSIKSVAPALLGEKLSYDDMEVAEGQGAQAAARKLIMGSVAGDEALRIQKALLEYCRQDTLAMVELVKWLMPATTQASPLQ
jgi:CRISPR/Cas system-associated exonuclease Cas4 (RecB family)